MDSIPDTISPARVLITRVSVLIAASRVSVHSLSTPLWAFAESGKDSRIAIMIIIFTIRLLLLPVWSHCIMPRQVISVPCSEITYAAIDVGRQILPQ